MKPVSVVRGRVMPLLRSDIDTDQIMPKQFLTRVERTGYGEHVFHEWRRDPGFVLNDPRFHGANILVTGSNFGAGSSREHAVWGLQQFGFDAVLAPSFSDIFLGNCAQSGLLAATVPENTSRLLADVTHADPATTVEIDLREQSVRWPGGTASFGIDAVARDNLLRGLDDVELILAQTGAIESYERVRPAWVPSTLRDEQ